MCNFPEGESPKYTGVRPENISKARDGFSVRYALKRAERSKNVQWAFLTTGQPVDRRKEDAFTG